MTAPASVSRDQPKTRKNFEFEDKYSHFFFVGKKYEN